MKAPKKATVLLLSAIMVLASFSLTFGQGGIYIESVDGLAGDMCFNDGATLAFDMRLTNATGENLAVISNGFSFVSGDLTWDGVTALMNPAYVWDLDDGYPCFFDLGMYENIFDMGPGYTIVGFGGGAGQFADGIPAGFDDVAWTITIGPIHGEGEFVLDTSFFEPAGYWLWGISGGTQVNPEWLGSLTYSTSCGGVPETYLEQDPILLKDLADRVLRAYVINEDVANIDLSSVTLQGKIPPYTVARIEGSMLVTDAFIFRFLSAYRPISSSVQSTYSIQYVVNGVPEELEGPCNIYVPAGDVTLDGYVDDKDAEFMRDYLWKGGAVSELEEMMDVDQNGQVDASDLSTLVDLIQ